MKYLTSLLLIILYSKSLIAQKQTSYFFGAGINTFSPKTNFFYAPDIAKYGEKAEEQNATSRLSPSFEIGLQRDFKRMRLYLGYQTVFYSYNIHPVTIPKSQEIITRIKFVSHNLNLIPCIKLQDFDIGIGPQFQYLSKPKVESTGNERHNIYDNNKLSVGLIFQANYNFALGKHKMNIGYQYSMYMSGKNPITVELVYDNDYTNYRYFHQPDFNSHTLRINYVFN